VTGGWCAARSIARNRRLHRFRWGRFFIIVEPELRERAGVAVGDTLSIVVEPTSTASALATARSQSKSTTAPRKAGRTPSTEDATHETTLTRVPRLPLSSRALERDVRTQRRLRVRGRIDVAVEIGVVPGRLPPDRRDRFADRSYHSIGAAVARLTVVPSPSCPYVLSPQHTMIPSARRAHE